MEPYPTPGVLEQNLMEALGGLEFVDQLYFSGWNYNPRVSLEPGAGEFFRRASDAVRGFCARYGIEGELGGGSRGGGRTAPCGPDESGASIGHHLHVCWVTLRAALDAAHGRLL